MGKITNYPLLPGTSIALDDELIIEDKSAGPRTKKTNPEELDKRWILRSEVAFATALGVKYWWISAADRTSETGMVEGELGLMTNTTSNQTDGTVGDLYQYVASAWVLQSRLFIDGAVLTSNLDISYKELLRNKTILSQQGPYYSGDGTDYLQAADNDNLDVNDYDFTICGWVKVDEIPSSNGVILRKGGADRYSTLVTTSGKLAVIIGSTLSGTITVVSDESIVGLGWVGYCTTCDRDDLTKLFVSGKKQQSELSSISDDISNTSTLNFLSFNGASEFLKAQIGPHRIYNRLLTDDEAISDSSNPKEVIDAADEKASQTAQTSGTLTIGYRYKIDTYVSSDDFTNVGAASNATGVEFIATGTTPTTWTNSSSLRHTGCMAEFDKAGPIQFRERQHGNNALNYGGTLNNAKSDSEYVNDYFSIADNDTFDVPVNCAFLEIEINVVTAEAGTTIRIGTSNGAQDVVADSTATQSTGSKKLTVLISGFAAGRGVVNFRC
jgi:hypothetical protein